MPAFASTCWPERTTASLTIRAVPEAVVARVKSAARRNGRSMEQELRHLLQTAYADKETTLARLRSLWPPATEVTTADVRDWREQGRP